jgi:hypothetical protein
MHPHPDEAISDREQTIDPAALRRLVARCQAVRGALGACETSWALNEGVGLLDGGEEPVGATER